MGSGGAMAGDEYRFDDYLATRPTSYLEGDRMLERWIGGRPLSGAADALIEHFGRYAATRLRAIADFAERRENLPRLSDPDPYHRGEVDVVIPAETREALAEIHGSGLWHPDLPERARYAVVYLLNQNGEAGVTCSTACTDGLARILRLRGRDGRSQKALEEIESSTPERFVHGAQFVTEIQGGSDAGTNALVARPAQDGLFELSGTKWFCSNPTADYWLVTGRVPGAPAGVRGVSLFCVPRQWNRRANGYRFLRLKDKLGTRALPTAEIAFEGARGWPVGPLEKGLRDMVAVVLVTSRIHCVLAAAAMTRAATREARAYAAFRSAFGRRLEEHPLLAASLEELEEQADLAEAGAFGTVDAWLTAAEKPDDEAQRVWSRVLVSLAKAVGTRRAVERIYRAMMVLGGNGIEERFSPLPRLWRDAAILEAWEGPYTLMLMQAFGDLVRFGVGGREESLLLFGLGERTTEELVGELAAVLRHADDPGSAVRFGDLAPRLYAAFEARARDELTAG